METSLNGWPALKSGDKRLATGVVPGTTRKVTLASACLPLFLHYLSAWNREMPARLKLNKGPLDGWEYRQARAASGFSNHSSGSATDCRYDVLLADGKPHMTAQEMAILDRILSRYVTKDGHHVLANGEWWNKNDGMHTELSQGWDRHAKRNTTAKDVAEVIKTLGIRPDGTAGVVKPPVVPVTPSVHVTFPGQLRVGMRNPAVKDLRFHLRLAAGDYFDKPTQAAVIRVQKANVSLGKADGIVGPMTWKKITGHK